MGLAKSNEAKKQHYIPRFMLRRYSVSGAGKQVWSFRKEDGAAFLSALPDAGSQNRWNQFELPTGELLEAAFGRVEDAAARALDRVIKTERTSVLRRSERLDVALFVVLQLLRTPGFRDLLRQRDRALGDMLGEAGRRFSKYVPVGEAALRDAHCGFVASRADEMVPAILKKTWVLQKATGHDRFVIGDSPVVRRHIRGDLGDQQWIPGIEGHGAEIYLPLTPSLMLAMWCPSLPAFDHRRRAAVARSGRLAPAPAVPGAALRGERAHLIEVGTVGHLNFMQLQMAYRHLYADREGFDDLQDMIRKDGRLARPPQVVVERESIFRSLARSAP